MRFRKTTSALAATLLLCAGSLSHAASITGQAQSTATSVMSGNADSTPVRAGSHCVEDGRILFGDHAAFVCGDGKLASIDGKQVQRQVKPVAVAIELTIAQPGGGATHTMSFTVQDGQRVHVDAGRDVSTTGGGFATGLSVSAIPDVLPNGKVELYVHVSDRRLDSLGAGADGKTQQPVVSDYGFDGQTIVKPGAPTLLLRRDLDGHPLELTVKVKVLDDTSSASS